MFESWLPMDSETFRKGNCNAKVNMILFLRNDPQGGIKRVGWVSQAQPILRTESFTGALQLPLMRKTDGVDNKTGSSHLPVGRFVDRRVESCLQKYFCFHAPQIISRTFRVPPHSRGVSRSSRTRGGMRWTRQRFARDGMAGRVL